MIKGSAVGGTAEWSSFFATARFLDRESGYSRAEMSPQLPVFAVEENLPGQPSNLGLRMISRTCSRVRPDFPALGAFAPAVGHWNTVRKALSARAKKKRSGLWGKK